MRSDKIRLENFTYCAYWENKIFDIVLSEMGWHDHSKPSIYYPSIKENYVIHFMIKGKGFYEVRGKKYELHENQIFIIYPAERVMYYPHKDEPMEYVWIGFGGKDAPKLIADAGLDNQYVLDFNAVSQVQNLLTPVLSDQLGIKDDNLYVQGLLHMVCSILLQNLRISGEKNTEKESEINKAVKYIETNYNKGLSVEKMAKALSISRTTLYKMFIKEFGISPNEYITDFKLDLALRYIRETDIPLKIIALNTGFVTYHHFSFMFKDRYGVSPANYKKVNEDNL